MRIAHRRRHLAVWLGLAALLPVLLLAALARRLRTPPAADPVRLPPGRA